MTTFQNKPRIRRRILLLAADTRFGAELKLDLEFHDEFVVFVGSNLRNNLNRIYAGSFDLLLIHSGTEDGEILPVCRLLRRNGVKIPIVVLANAPAESDEILAFEYGANDYLDDRASKLILVSRMRAHLRQYLNSDDAVFKFGPRLFLPGKRMVKCSETERKIHLTPKETEILLVLCRHQGFPMMREEMYRQVWPTESRRGLHTLESHIYRLRQKVETDVTNPVHILSVPGGYQLSR